MIPPAGWNGKKRRLLPVFHVQLNGIDFILILHLIFTNGVFIFTQ
jgi:hypothetical protein